MDEEVILYLVNKKITRNMELIRLYNKHKAEYPDFPKAKLLAQNEMAKRIKELFDDGFITFDKAVKAIVNIDD